MTTIARDFYYVVVLVFWIVPPFVRGVESLDDAVVHDLNFSHELSPSPLLLLQMWYGPYSMPVGVRPWSTMML